MAADQAGRKPQEGNDDVYRIVVGLILQSLHNVVELNSVRAEDTPSLLQILSRPPPLASVE